MTILRDGYFGWSAIVHEVGCRETLVNFQYRIDDVRVMERTTLQVRVVCPACGAVFEIESRVPNDVDGYGHTENYTDVATIGYGQKPQKTCGLYLWPGRVVVPTWRPSADNPPGSYLVTVKPERPEFECDVFGAIYLRYTERRATRFGAVLGYAPAIKEGPTDFKTPRGAAKWLAGQLAAMQGVTP